MTRLPLLYAALLVAEVAVLATLVAMCGTHAPYRYEAGYAAVASFVAMQLYSVRRRVRLLWRAGSLDRWLDAHVFLGLQGFVFVAYHAVGLVAALDLASTDGLVVAALVLTGLLGRRLVRTEAIWSLLHRPLAFLLLALTTLHVLAHFAYAR